MADNEAHLVREGARLVSREKGAREALERAVDDGESLKVKLACSGALLAMSDPAPTFVAASIEALSVVELLTVLVGAGQTGSVEVQSAMGVRRLFVEDGRFTGTSSTHVEDRLGEIMWRNGRISLDQMMIASANVTAEKKLGRVLIELGFLSSGDVRGGLREQARAVFEAACLLDKGTVVFLGGEKNPWPIAFPDGADVILDDIVASVAEVEKLQRTVGDLDVELSVVTPPPDVRIDESEQALLQLIMSRRASAFTKREAMDRSGLGRKLGLRALERLLFFGFIEEEEQTPPVPLRPMLERLCDALILVVQAMDRDGFGIGDVVREWLATPPDAHADVLASVDLDALSTDTFSVIANSTEGGVAKVETALRVLLDFALFETIDAIPRDDGQALSDQVRSLNVL